MKTHWEFDDFGAYEEELEEDTADYDRETGDAGPFLHRPACRMP